MNNSFDDNPFLGFSARTGLPGLEQEVLDQKVNLESAITDLEENLQGIFTHLESMAAHIVAIESVLEQALVDKAIDQQAVRNSIQQKLSNVGGNSGPALEVAKHLLANAR